jgi:hypothetical protein
MAKTATASTSTRSLQSIVEEFVSYTDSGSLRYHQARLTYEFIGSTEGKEAAELKEQFRKDANEALRRKHETELSVPGVTNLVNTWKYMLRANVDTSPETNESIFDVAKASFNFASQTFRKKEENYVTPAIEAILNGADPEATFVKQTVKLKADKKKDADSKDAPGSQNKDADKAITFDSIVAMLKVVPTLTLDDSQKSTLRDLIAAASVAVA